jgi:hypothetical protein
MLHVEAPEDVLDRLDAAGYRELSPMARRGQVYKLSAVDPRGNLVALEISIFTGEIERADVLRAAYARPPVRAPRPVAAPAVAPVPRRAPAPAVAARPAPQPAPGSNAMRNRLQPPAEAQGGDDPMVVY